MDVSNSSVSTGVYHIHSDYSYDSSNSLAAIAEWARRLGLEFVLLTEHDLGFDQPLFEQYQAACSKHSQGVRLVPGMEYEVIHQGAIVHIGAIGLPRLIEPGVVEQGIVPLVDEIHAQGGIAVLHHPNNVRHVLEPAHVFPFDFVEIWNTKFDCDFAPNAQFLEWLKRIGWQGPCLVSADIHDVRRFNEDNVARVQLDPHASGRGDELPDVAGIINGLVARRYRCRKGKWELLPDGTRRVPNATYRSLPSICLVKKKVFRSLRYLVPKTYQKAVFRYVNRAWIR